MRVFDLCTTHDYRDNGNRLVYGEIIVGGFNRCDASTANDGKIHPPQRVVTLDMPFSFLADSTWNSTTDEKETGIEIGSHFRFYIRLAVVNALL